MTIADLLNHVPRSWTFIVTGVVLLIASAAFWRWCWTRGTLTATLEGLLARVDAHRVVIGELDTWRRAHGIPAAKLGDQTTRRVDAVQEEARAAKIKIERLTDLISLHEQRIHALEEASTVAEEPMETLRVSMRAASSSRLVPSYAYRLSHEPRARDLDGSYVDVQVPSSVFVRT